MEVFPDETATATVSVLHRAIARFAALGVVAERLLTDNGSFFRSLAFDTACLKLGVCQRCTLVRIARRLMAEPNADQHPAHRVAQCAGIHSRSMAHPRHVPVPHALQLRATAQCPLRSPSSLALSCASVNNVLGLHSNAS